MIQMLFKFVSKVSLFKKAMTLSKPHICQCACSKTTKFDRIGF